uniref:Uncharacterized protein n=1 Tax=Rhizophora mucronata TaxID=61149 RepID=A0A2P2PAS9_RHIMU
MKRKATKKKLRMPMEGSRGFKRLNFLKKYMWVTVSACSCGGVMLMMLLFFIFF